MCVCVYTAYPTHVCSNYASVLHMPTHFLGPGARIFDIWQIPFCLGSWRWAATAVLSARNNFGATLSGCGVGQLIVRE